MVWLYYAYLLSALQFTISVVVAFHQSAPIHSLRRPRKLSYIKIMSAASTHHEHRKGDGKFHFSIDRGGTFTDVHCKLPNGTELVSKLLSVDPSNYPDAPTEGIRRILDAYDPTGKRYPRGEKVTTSLIGSIRMGTTVATNALLEREGERMGLVTTKGFGDLLKIGDQTRSDM